MNSCGTCSFKRYVGDGVHMCTHRDAQLVLARKGVSRYGRADFVTHCPFHSYGSNSELIGVQDIRVLDGIADANRPKVKEKVNQGDLF